MKFTRRFLLLQLLVVALLCATTTTTDITPNGTATPIASSGTARWVQIIADPNNSAAIRVGDFRASSTAGARLAPGGGLMLPPQGQNYTLAYIYVWGAAGTDKVSVLWGD
jgi:hypothetical protein